MYVRPCPAAHAFPGEVDREIRSFDKKRQFFGGDDARSATRNRAISSSMPKGLLT